MYADWDKGENVFSQISFGNGDFQNTHPGNARALIAELCGERP